MSTLRLTTLTLPAADLGPENPLPPLRSSNELHTFQSIDPAIPAEMRRNMSYGRLPNLLPYSIQDGYTREKQPRDLRVAVLENAILRAAFLLDFGGRLWSLFHKPSGRELLTVNPVFQPANLALRNAWFSGGVEWNIGTIGHTPFTCAPLFAARLQDPHGEPILRLYEWERIRQATYQIDAWLPEDLPVLFVRVSICNPRDEVTPMYWWSNIAVPETADTRVLVPAVSAYRFTYGDLNIISVPQVEELDITYATRLRNAADFFFHIPENRQPWIAALDGAGRGLFQVSTPLLQGRKLFVWGMGRGGRKWQEFLSQPGEAYLEIQAGLARTQLEHLPMPAHARWEWLEAYGLLEVDPQTVHGSDWEKATAMAAAAIEAQVPGSELESELTHTVDRNNQAPFEMLHLGSGWGALEQKRRAAAGEPALPLTFGDASLTAAQQPWLELLQSGHFPEYTPENAPLASLVQPEWQALLENAVNLNENWLALLHLGVMRHYHGDLPGARRAWETSLRIARTPWALRNLAVLNHQEGYLGEAAACYLEACRLKPDLLVLAVECGQFLVENGFAQRWVELLPEFSPETRQNGRICLLEAQACLVLGMVERCGQIIAALPVIADLREGELSLSNLWDEYQAQALAQRENAPLTSELRARARQQFPLPERLDFRMIAEEPVSTKEQ